MIGIHTKAVFTSVRGPVALEQFCGDFTGQGAASNFNHQGPLEINLIMNEYIGYHIIEIDKLIQKDRVRV